MQSPDLRRALLPLGCAAGLALAGGCESIRSAASALKKPEARVTGARLTDLSLKSASLAFDVEIANPYGAALPLTDVRYAIASEGNRFLSGEAETAGKVPARSRKTITVPASLSFPAMTRALKDVRPGSVVPYRADLTLSVDAPGAGTLELPVHKTGELPVPAVPGIALEGVRWRELTLQSAAAVLSLRVENPNAFAVELAQMGYDLALGGRRVAAGGLERQPEIPAGEARTLEVPIEVSPAELGFAALNLFRGEGADYEIAGELALGTRFGPIRMPYEAQGETPFRR